LDFVEQAKWWTNARFISNNSKPFQPNAGLNNDNGTKRPNGIKRGGNGNSAFLNGTGMDGVTKRH
jgi:hypothetical protein